MKFFYQLLLMVLIFVAALVGAYVFRFFFHDNPFVLMIGACACAFTVFMLRNKIFALFDKVTKQYANKRE